MEADLAPAAAAIGMDTPCIHCGYNLRGLTADGMCPECGKLIGDSLRGDLLRFANANWLRKVRLGIALHLWSIGLGIVLGAIGGGLAAGGAIGAGFVTWVQLLVVVIGLWGTFALTTREPREALQDEGVSVRTLLRTAACLGVVAYMVHLGEELLPEVVLQAVGILGIFVAPVQHVLFLVYLRRFALRVPDEKLYRSSTRLIYVGAVCYGLFAVAAAILVLGAVNNPQVRLGLAAPPGGGAAVGARPLSMFLGVAMMILPLVLLVLFFWYVRLLGKYRKLLAEQVMLAGGGTA